MNDPYHSPAPESTPPPVSPPGLSSDERMWAMFGHLSALVGLITGGLGFVVGPLIVWQIKKETMPFASAEAKEALNFNISWLIWNAILWLVTVTLMLIFIGVLLLPVAVLVTLAWIVLIIIAGIKANDGKPYRYPLTIRFIT